MNQEYLVMIDDQFPINLLSLKSIFSLSTKGNYLWPLIIFKALLKFHNKSIEHLLLSNFKEDLRLKLTSDIIYSLTGYICLEFNTNNFESFTNLRNQLLNSTSIFSF